MNGFGNFILPFELEPLALGLRLHQEAEIIKIGHGEVSWALIGSIRCQRRADKIANASQAMLQQAN